MDKIKSDAAMDKEEAKTMCDCYATFSRQDHRNRHASGHERDTENNLELGEYLNGMIVQDIILEHSLSSSERDALHQYRNMIDELITPRLKDLDYEQSKSICDALDDGNSIGL